ncbi:hypothetical protein V8J36_20880, partial [Frigidibacter sp. MR17.14]|uniref:hypothetical protein n=1 Tax=Frigidibacter sp. MR17.14 TaxID=3126509 RepID=UPI00301316BD
SPTVVISDMTASPNGLLRSHLGTSMPSGGGYIINALQHLHAELCVSLAMVLRPVADHGSMFDSRQDSTRRVARAMVLGPMADNDAFHDRDEVKE